MDPILPHGKVDSNPPKKIEYLELVQLILEIPKNDHENQHQQGDFTFFALF